ncbi:hypothetical protein Deima_0037 [Deinococcus maricopensis DSM 21211]|uniref:Uncharacterized protein n=1 Tax=Deinococcus maricopensis (strain DSM 21211 / LMG 22137 / NRRL B-23946 / LB-34) TaxID=709986 RepID=E8U407_DEIML|nr:hypothetical protein Deima_0037 [Deinococcus maricopensis DSM 21211]
MYLAVGTGTGKLNDATEGVAASCVSNANILYKDNSTATTLTTAYCIDVWDKRGSRFFTMTPSALTGTNFASTGAPTGAAVPAN